MKRTDKRSDLRRNWTEVAEDSDLRRDRGFTFVETVVAVVLVATVMVSLLAAVRATVTSSSFAQEAAQVETALVNAADRINRAPGRCDYSVYVRAAVQIQGWDPDTTVLSVDHKYLEPGASSSDPGVWKVGPSQPGCPTDQYSDLLVQLVTVRITSPDGRVTRSLEVVKSEI